MDLSKTIQVRSPVHLLPSLYISNYHQLSAGCQNFQLIPGPQWPPSADQPEVERNRGRTLSILPSYKVAATQVEGIDDDHDCDNGYDDDDGELVNLFASFTPSGINHESVVTSQSPILLVPDPATSSKAHWSQQWGGPKDRCLSY